MAKAKLGNSVIDLDRLIYTKVTKKGQYSFSDDWEIEVCLRGEGMDPRPIVTTIKCTGDEYDSFQKKMNA